MRDVKSTAVKKYRNRGSAPAVFLFITETYDRSNMAASRKADALAAEVGSSALQLLS